MSNLELPPGEYQAEISSVLHTKDAPALSIGNEPETLVFFRLTEPAEDDKKNPQAGLGGRITRSWFATGSDNPATAADAQEKLDTLLRAAGAETLDDAIGRIVRIRVTRIVRRADPSKFQIAAVEFLPLIDTETRPYV